MRRGIFFANSLIHAQVKWADVIDFVSGAWFMGIGCCVAQFKVLFFVHPLNGINYEK